MEFWAHINGVDYPAVLGPAIVDNLGEELDSMEIVIPHSAKIQMKPYDDVYVHDGWYHGREYGQITATPAGHFYRHFLVHNYSQNEVNQIDHIYNYSISLISETKYLERIALPNRTITIPLNREGKSVLDMAKIFVKRYTPKIKYSDDYSEAQGQGTWEWKDKFIVSERSVANFTEAQLAELEKRQLEIVGDVLSGIQAQEVSFNNPTLREVLTKIFSVSNRIPVVYDNMIFARNLSKKHNRIVGGIKGKIWDTTTMDGEQYVDRLRKNYASGLTDKNGVIFHEYVGFRNMNVASMRYSDLTIELRNPIYKINKFFICFYAKVKDSNGNDVYKLKKLDVSSFVLPSATRALLSNDYLTFRENKPKTINGYVDYTGSYILGLCDYKFMTVQYDIGSKTISGFGETLKYTTNGIDYIEKIILENILSVGIESGFGNVDLEEDMADGEFNPPHPITQFYGLSEIVAPIPSSSFWNALADVPTALMARAGGGDVVHSNDSLKMKSLFFEVEYQGIMSAASYVSKDMHDGDIVSVDNQQESLAVMELDGLVSKLKANRLGNEVSSVTARVMSADDLVEIGDYDDEHGVCYKRTIGVEKDYLSVHYIFAKDYVITNYFTGVFSKYRSSAYASVAQSVERNEIANVQLLLSADKELRNPQTDMNFSYDFKLSDVISIFKNSDDLDSSIAYFSVVAPKQGEYAYAYKEYDQSQLELQHFSVDRAYYMSGNSMCCSFGMSDSETAGTYIRQIFPNPTTPLLDALNVGPNVDPHDNVHAYQYYAFSNTALNDITGTAQDFLSLPQSRDDGSLNNMEFSLKFSRQGGMDKAYDPQEGDTPYPGLKLLSIFNDKLYKLPKLTQDVIDIYDDGVGVSIQEEFKDAKEIIHETFQIEPISQDSESKKIKFSPYLLKLSDIYNRTKKRNYETQEKEVPFPLLAITDQRIQGATDPRMVHSLGLYSGSGDFGLIHIQRMVEKYNQGQGTALNQVIEYDLYDTLIGHGTKTKIGKLTVTIHGIRALSKDSRTGMEKIDVDMSFSVDTFGENRLIYYTETDFGKKKKYVYRISTPKFTTAWWRADQIKNLFGDNTVNLFGDATIGYPNHKFYPQYNDPNTYGNEDMKVFRYVYQKHEDSSDNSGTNCAFFLPTETRKCFSFNFETLPSNTGITMLYDRSVDEYGEEEGPQSGRIVVSYQSMSEIWGNTYPRGAGYSDIANSLNAMACVSLCAFSHYDISETDPHGGNILPSQIGPNEAVTRALDHYLDPVMQSPNIIWALKNDAISDDFDTMRTYSEITELQSAGFNIVSLPSGSYGGFVDDTLNKILVILPANSNYKSAYMFYYDDDKRYHFVFGCDGTTLNGTFSSGIHASMVYDRSRTVFNSNMEPVLMTANYAKVNSDADNICVDKKQDNE